MAKPSSYLQCPNSPNHCSCFAHLQSQGSGTVWPRNSVECRSAWSRSSKSFASSEAWSSSPKQGSWVTACLIAEYSSQPCLNRKSSQNIWKLCSPTTLKQRVWQAELIICRAKPVAPFGQGTWGGGQLESSPQRALLVLELLFLFSPGRGTNL